jgi:hypothetical protein
MSIEILGILAEVVGAFAVVISVIYLASQIRQSYAQLDQNNVIAKAAAESELHFKYQELLRTMLDRPGLREIVIRGLNDYESLTMQEKGHFGMWATPLVVHFDVVLRQYSHGLVDENYLEEFRLMTLSLVSTEGGRAWWAENKYFWIETVRKYLDEELAKPETLPEPFTVMSLFQFGPEELKEQLK